MYKFIHINHTIDVLNYDWPLPGLGLKKPRKQEHCSNFSTSLIESALARSFPLEHCPTHANIQEHC